MLLDEFLVVLGVKADTREAKEFANSLDDVSVEAEKTEKSLIGAYEATDGFVSAVEGALGVLGFFTGALGGAWAFFHGTISELEELIEEEKLLTKVTKEQLDQAKKYNDSVETLGKRFNSLKVELAFGFLPTMQRMIDAVDEFLESNKDLIVDGILGFLNAITSTFRVIGNFISFIDMVIERTIGWDAALIGLVGGLLWVNRAMLIAFATNPITWVVAAIVGLMLLIDDFMTYLDGGESLFGDFWGSMLEWIDEVKPALQSVWDMLVLGMSYLIEFGVFVTRYFGGALVDAVQVIVAALTMLYALFTGNTELMAAAWDGLVENMLSMFRNFASLFEPLAQLLVSIMSSVWDSIVSAIQQRIGSIIAAIQSFISTLSNVLSSVFDVVTAPFARAFDWISNKFSSLGGLISGAVSGAGRLFGMGASSATNSTVNNGGNMTVHAPINVVSNDPNKAAKLVRTGVTDTMNTAHRNMGSRVKA